jgi:hypothetical protein
LTFLNPSFILAVKLLAGGDLWNQRVKLLNHVERINAAEKRSAQAGRQGTTTLK